MTIEELVDFYSGLMNELFKVLEKNGKKEDELLSDVEIHFGGYSHRVFACYAGGKLKYVPGKPGIYLKSDTSINVMDNDAILVENTDTNATVVPCENAMLYTYQYPLDITKIPNDENRGWNENYFILTFKGSKLEKAIAGTRGAAIMQDMNTVLEKYNCCLDSEDATTMYLISPELNFYSAKPYPKRRRANQLPLFRGIYETWKALTDNNNTGSWCYMAYEFNYHGNEYTLTCGNLVEYDLFYREANEKIRKRLEKMGATDLKFISKKVM